MKKQPRTPIQRNGSRPHAEASTSPSDHLPIEGVLDAGSKVEILDLDAMFAQVSKRLISIGAFSLQQFEPPSQKPVELVQLLVFSLGDVRYALNIRQVVEVLGDAQVTPVPGLPEWVLGVTNLHGDIVSVVDLGTFLQIRRHGNGNRRVQKTVVAEVADQRIGLMVDSVDVIYSFPQDQILSPPFEVPAELAPYLRGATEYERSFIRVLDGECLLTGSQMQQFQ